MRDRIPNSDRLWALRPYDEIVAHRLSRVAGVIVTFAVDGHARIPTEVETGNESSPPAWHALDPPKQQELFLRLGGSSCDLLPDPLPTVIVQELVCCDVIPSSEDSCTLGLTAVSLPPESLLERLRGGG